MGLPYQLWQDTTDTPTCRSDLGSPPIHNPSDDSGCGRLTAEANRVLLAGNPSAGAPELVTSSAHPNFKISQVKMCFKPLGYRLSQLTCNALVSAARLVSARLADSSARPVSREDCAGFAKPGKRSKSKIPSSFYFCSNKISF